MIAEAKLAILGVAAVTLLAAGFAGGHRWQAGEVADAEKAQAEAEIDRDKWRDAAAGYKRATERWQATVEANAREAEKQLKQAQALIEQADVEEARAKRDAAAWRERFQKAQRDPSCAELMEATACPAFRSY